MIGDREVEIVHNRSQAFFCSCNADELPRDKELSEQQLKPGDFLSLETGPFSLDGKEALSTFCATRLEERNAFFGGGDLLLQIHANYKHIIWELEKLNGTPTMCQQLSTPRNWTRNSSSIPPTLTSATYSSNSYLCILKTV